MLQNDYDLFDSNNLIFAYTRAEAIADGELVDVTADAMKSGFKIPVAVTRAVWNDYIQWNNEDTDRQTNQDKSGRLADALWMLYLACKRNRDEAYIQYKLYVIPRDGNSISPVWVALKAVICGGDDGEPVITIMLPNED